MGRSFRGGGSGGGFSGGGRGGGFSGGGGRSFGGGGGSFGGGRSFGGSSGGRSFGGGGSFGGSFGGPPPGGGNHNRHHNSGSSGLLPGLILGSLLSRSSSGGPGGPPGGQQPQGPHNSRRGGLGWCGCACGCLALAFAIVILLTLLGFVFNASSCSSVSVDASTVEREALPASAVEETNYYTDEGGWITSSSTLESGMRYFYEKTGVQPYLYILPNGTTTSTDELAEQAEELYSELFSDEGHFIIVFCDDNNESYNVGYWIGSTAESVLDNEAITIFAQYLARNYEDDSISDEEVFSNTYVDTADRIMNVTTSPLVIVGICVAVVAVVVGVVFIVRYRTKAKAEEQRRHQEILNTPLEKFGDKTLEDLERKYE